MEAMDVTCIDWDKVAEGDEKTRKREKEEKEKAARLNKLLKKARKR